MIDNSIFRTGGQIFDIAEIPVQIVSGTFLLSLGDISGASQGYTCSARKGYPLNVLFLRNFDIPKMSLVVVFGASHLPKETKTG